MIEQTKTILSALKCHGMLGALDIRLHEATSQGWGHGEFLSALVTDEKLHRETLKTWRRVRAAHFRTEASFEKLDLTAKRNLTKPQVQNLMELHFLKAPKNVMLFGATGVGKTFLATALGNQACREGYSVLFYGVNLLLEKFALHRADGTFLRFREKLTRCDLLILDDLGIKQLPPAAAQDLYDILEERYQSKSTAITSQLPIANWKEVIEDPVVLEAIVDRLIHGAVTITLQGESYRKKRGQE